MRTAALPWRLMAPLSIGLALAAAALPAAGLELNSASQAELESLKGIGPGLSEALLRERQRRPFADWADAAARVPGLGPRSARRLVDQGVTVGPPPATATPKPP